MQVPRRFLDFCVPVTLPVPWSGLRPEVRLFGLPEFGTSVLAQFEEEFLEAELLRSGLVRETFEGLVWHPELNAVQGATVVEATPCGSDIVLKTLPHLNSAGDLMVGSVFADGVSRAAEFDAETPVLVTFDTVDLYLLQSLGLPAVGLEHLSAEAVWRFVRQTAGCKSPEQITPSSEMFTPLSLIFVGSSLATLNVDRPPALAPLTRWLLQAEQSLQWDLSRVHVWLPSNEDLHRIDFCLQADDHEALRRSLLESIESSQFMLDVAADDPNEVPSGPTYLEALGRHRRFVEEGKSDSRDGRQARGQLVQAIDDNLIVPMLEQAAGERPIARNLLTVAAAVARSLHLRLVDDESFGSSAPMHGDRRRGRDNALVLTIRTAHQFRALCAELRR